MYINYNIFANFTPQILMVQYARSDYQGNKTKNLI